MSGQEFYDNFIKATKWMELEGSFLGRNVLKAVKEAAGLTSEK